jgi:hypothetical protein
LHQDGPEGKVEALDNRKGVVRQGRVYLTNVRTGWGWRKAEGTFEKIFQDYPSDHAVDS